MFELKILKWMVGLLAAFVVLNVILYFALAELGEVVAVDTGQSEALDLPGKPVEEIPIERFEVTPERE